MRAQKSISVRGPVEYAVEYKNNIATITEAKKKDLGQGVVQNEIQLDSTGKQAIPLQKLTQ